MIIDAESTGEGPWERADGFSIFTPDSTIVKLKSGDQLYDCRVFMQGQDEFKVILVREMHTGTTRGLTHAP